MVWEHDERHIWTREPASLSVPSNTIMCSQKKLKSKSTGDSYIDFLYEVNQNGAENIHNFKSRKGKQSKQEINCLKSDLWKSCSLVKIRIETFLPLILNKVLSDLHSELRE